MKRIVQFSIIAIVAAALAVSCSRSEFEPNETGQGKSNGLGLTATQSDFTLSGEVSEGASTRVVETAFQEGDSVGLFIHQTLPVNATGSHSTNVCYVLRSNKWNANDALAGELTPSKIYYATGYHPQKRTVTNPTAIPHRVEADQSTAHSPSKAAALERSDFLMTTAAQQIADLSTEPSVALNFKHMMNKFVVKFTTPTALDGVAVIDIKAVTYKGFSRGCLVDLANSSISTLSDVGDIIPRRTGGDGKPGVLVTYEAIVVPQTIKGAERSAPIVDIVCNMQNGTTRSLSYTVPATTDLALKSGEKYTLTLSSIAEVAFMNELDLIDGLAKTDLMLKIKAPLNQAWELTSEGSWLQLSKTTGSGYSAKISGTGKGAEETVYVRVEANDSQSTAVWTPRQAKITIKAGTAAAYYTAIQNYYRFAAPSAPLQPTAGQTVLVVAAFGANQEWSATSSTTWALLSSNAIYGQGSPSQSYGPVMGALGANKLHYQLSANNTNVQRKANISYTPSLYPSSKVTVEITQTAPALATGVLETTLASATNQPASEYKVTRSVTSATGLNWKLEGDSKNAELEVSHTTAQSASANDIVIKLAPNNSSGARTVTYTLHYGAMDGTLKSSYTVAQVAPTMTLVPAADVSVAKAASTGADLFTVTVPKGVKWKVISVTPETGKNMELSLSAATGAEQVGTGAEEKVTGSYKENTGVARYTNVLLGFAAFGTTQQKTIKVTQVAAGPPVNPPTDKETIKVGNVTWATGNLVAVSGKSNECKVGAPTDGGLYFQFGSLIGWKGGATGDGTGRPAKANNTFMVGSSFNAENEVHVKPDKFTTISGIGTTWPSQAGNNQYYFGHNAAPYSTAGQNIKDFTGFATGTLADKGVGDPCTYYLGSPWRMPTNLEYQALHDAGTKSYPGSWSNTSTTSYFQIAIGANTIKFPAVGRREVGYNGGFYVVGDQGYYWSSSVQSGTAGYYLWFYNGSVNPQNGLDRRRGFPVRCVE